MSYERVSRYFSEVRNRNVREVGNLIGGKVKINIDNGIFANACALRLSYALNKAGYTISSSDGAVGSGDDNKWYLYQVPDIIKYAKNIAKKVENGNSLSDLKKEKGIIVFGECNWTNATGHVDLFNGFIVEGNDFPNNLYRSITLCVL